MPFNRMKIEEWFDRYQFEAEFDIGESGMKFLQLSDIPVDLSGVELRYGHHRGSPELRSLITQQYPGFEPDQICVTTGASESIFSILASVVGPGDQVIVQHPNYPTLYEAGRSLDRDVQLFSLRFEDSFLLDFDRLERMVTDRTKLVMLTYPNNPTGAVIGEDELRQAIQWAEGKGVHLLVDETYRDLSFDPPPSPAATLSEFAISVTSMSKTYRVPGIRIGWMAGTVDLVDQVRAVREQLTICNSALGEWVALSILKEREERVRSAKKLALKNLGILKEWMETRDDLEWVEPKGGVVSFPRVRGVEDATELCRTLIEKYRTFVVPGSCFEMPEHFRLGFGGDTEELIGGLECLGLVLRER